MATTAITKLTPTDEKKIITRAKAPKTGGVRHPCVFCNSKGYSTRSEHEQRELLALMSETEQLRQGNYRRERKLRVLDKEMEKIKLMNIEMDDFFKNIPLGKVIPDDQNVVNIKPSESSNSVREASILEEIKIWKEKEKKIESKLLEQKKLNHHSKRYQGHHNVPREMWGHQTISWTPYARPLPPRPGCPRAPPSGPIGRSSSGPTGRQPSIPP